MAPNWFIAIPVPLGPESLALTPPPGVRLFAPSDLHITVAFLGNVTAERAKRAFEASRAIPLAPLRVTLGRVLPLGPARRPSAFSALLVQGREPVERAMGSVRGLAYEAAGVRRDERPPLAHVTLARPKRDARASERGVAAAWASSLVLPASELELSQLALYTWGDRQNALFRIECAAPLGASP
jgi:2'-5' RNA ligase